MRSITDRNHNSEKIKIKNKYVSSLTLHSRSSSPVLTHQQSSPCLESRLSSGVGSKTHTLVKVNELGTGSVYVGRNGHPPFCSPISGRIFVQKHGTRHGYLPRLVFSIRLYIIFSIRWPDIRSIPTVNNTIVLSSDSGGLLRICNHKT